MALLHVLLLRPAIEGNIGTAARSLAAFAPLLLPLLSSEDRRCIPAPCPIAQLHVIGGVASGRDLATSCCHCSRGATSTPRLSRIKRSSVGYSGDTMLYSCTCDWLARMPAHALRLVVLTSSRVTGVTSLLEYCPRSAPVWTLPRRPPTPRASEGDHAPLALLFGCESQGVRGLLETNNDWCHAHDFNPYYDAALEGLRAAPRVFIPQAHPDDSEGSGSSSQRGARSLNLGVAVSITLFDLARRALLHPPLNARQ